MRSGDYLSAWRISDEVLAWRVARGERCGQAPRHRQFVWRGEPLAGRRVLVRCYHGLGDSLQFLRFAIPLARVAREVTWWIQPQLVELAQCVPGVRALPLHDGTPDVDRDVDVESMELPHALRVRPDELAAHVPYVRIAARPRERGKRLSAGLAWKGGTWDPARALDDGAVAALLDRDDVEFHSLQYPPADCGSGIAQAGCADVMELARRMRSLDLVISVDTMTAHLAGAMGMPTWTLLAHDCDWRWMTSRTDTPWYPSMRLYRQCASGDWTEVLRRIAADLTRAARREST